MARHGNDDGWVAPRVASATLGANAASSWVATASRRRYCGVGIVEVEEPDLHRERDGDIRVTTARRRGHATTSRPQPCDDQQQEQADHHEEGGSGRLVA
jgi:hypothetical protein